MDNNIRINPLEHPTVKCECGCSIWKQGVILKKISGLAIGTGAKDQLIDLPVYYCAKCGKVFPEDAALYKLDEEQTEKNKTLIVQ